MNQSFVEQLIELRNQYRLQQLENEQRKHHLAQQLTHVDALLVDQLESSNLFASLVELRHQYQQQIAECDRHVAHFQEQLTHVNALLADQIVQQHEHLTLQATIEQQRALIESQQSKERSLIESPESVREEISEESGLEKGLNEQIAPASDETVNGNANSAFQAATEELTTNLEQAEPQSNEAISELLEELDKPSSPEAPENSPATPEILEESRGGEQYRETPLLSQYQHLTQREALSQLMEEKAGSALHIDWLLRELYGELAEEQIATERDRLGATLKDGVKQGLWEKVPGASECYTLNLKLVEPDEAEKTTEKQQHQAKSTSVTRAALTVLPQYLGLKLIDAVELVVSDKAGELLTTNLVVKALYGDVSGRALTQAKEIVGKTLWRGADIGRWQQMPRQKGVYTLDVRIIEPTPDSNDTPSRVQKAGQKPLKIQPAYSRMSFTEAVATVLREHIGEVMTPEQVARILYGDELSGTRLSTARMKVNRALWDGASKKKWRRLTGAIGRYTLD